MQKHADTILFGILYLFLLQLISDFIESIYSFGLVQTQFTIEVASILLFFAPAILILFRKGLKRRALLILASLGMLCRLFAPMLPPQGKMLVSGLGMALLLLFFVAWLAGRRSLLGQSIAHGLILAIGLSVFFRTLGSGSDLSVTNPLIGLALLGSAGWCLMQANLTPEPYQDQFSPTSWQRLVGLAIGVGAVLLMLYFAFASPTVISRWTGISYPLIVVVLIVNLVIFAALLGSSWFTHLLSKPIVIVWNALFLATLVLTILPHQIAFPTAASAYPFDAPPGSLLAILPLLCMLVLSPVIVVDLVLVARGIVSETPTPAQLGGAFSLASLLFLVFVFFHVFTTIYDYAPVVGPFFRDRFWFVYLLAGLALTLPVFLVQLEDFDFSSFTRDLPIVVLTATIALATVFSLAYTLPFPQRPPTHKNNIVIMTYNIQQGYSENGEKNLAGQLEVIRKVDPDILGLQESDTARVANGNVDVVRYFADNLGMYSYYGATTTTGTFGIALLSKYPIEEPKTFFMFSEGEQTATIQAQIFLDNRPYNVLVTHLGNEGPIVQLENMLMRTQSLENVLAMGDYNFTPRSPQYKLITQSLVDSWLLKWPGGKAIPGYSPEKRIDHIFLSSGIEVLDSEYVVDPASDHPYQYTIIQP